jgi:hypothetical protein
VIGAHLTGDGTPLFMDYYLLSTTSVIVTLILTDVYNIQNNSTVSNSLFGRRKAASITWSASDLLRAGWSGI